MQHSSIFCSIHIVLKKRNNQLVLYISFTDPPNAPTHQVSYENIWIDPVAKKPQLKPIPEPEVASPPPVPPRLKSKQPSFLARSSNEDSAISSSASSSSNDVHVLSSNQNSPPQRSFSAMNLATKFASNIKRKMSDQHIVQFQGRTRTRSAFLTTAASPAAMASYQSNLKTRSGVLYVYSRSRRTFQVRIF